MHSVCRGPDFGLRLHSAPSAAVAVACSAAVEIGHVAGWNGVTGSPALEGLYSAVFVVAVAADAVLAFAAYLLSADSADYRMFLVPSF